VIARVLPDLPAVDRPFDYLVPDAVRDQVRVGSLVRIELHGRRVGGWVVDLAGDDASEVAPERLKPLAKLSSDGPPPEVVSLAAWAAWRWAGRWVHLLRAASPPANVHTPEPPDEPEGVVPGDVVVRRMAPSADRLPLVLEAAALGPALVVVPGVELAARLADRLRREGHRTALLAGDVRATDYALAASGQATVVGTRAAVWAPVPDAALRSVLVLDEHDEALQSEQAPTWHAREVAVERARRAGVPCTLVSPVPTLAALAARAGGPLGVELPPDVDAGERGGWPIVEVVDRRSEEPGRGSLFTSRLVDLLRSDGRVVCVLNRIGRARLLGCTSCGTIADCERCGAAVSMLGDAELVCGHCGTTRPVVCAACGSGRFKNLRMGVTRAREELEALAGEPVAEVTGSSAADELPSDRVVIGTEAVLHRLPAASASVVAFLDLDQELLAPRYRAAEQAMALLARASRVAGPRRGGGRLLLQTRHPDHAVVQSVALGDPGRLTPSEAQRRSYLMLPPFGAVALVSGPGATEWAAGAPDVEGIQVLDGPEATWMVRAPDHEALADYLDLVERPPERTRIEVDPPRL
jgi:primosomal protein N' (replication factor Y)